jgi:hypothetical protein
MIAVSTLLASDGSIVRRAGVPALLLGLAVTAYFHIEQAVDGLVNWAMPQPWHWNLLGVWHAVYMLTIATLLALYFIVSAVHIYRKRTVPLSLVISVLCLISFFVLLGTDYL